MVTNENKENSKYGLFCMFQYYSSSLWVSIAMAKGMNLVIEGPIENYNTPPLSIQ